MNWQLNRIQYPVYNLGEGKRVGIWVQGCSLGCEGCLSPTLWDFNKGKSIPVMDLFNWLITLGKEYDGVTISGGEPFQQYEQLITFLYLIKTRTSLSTLCYTGYYIHELQQLFPDKLFQQYVDILIDGRYIKSGHENSDLKSSRNQTVYQFVNFRPRKVKETQNSPKWSIHVSEDNQIYMAGVPGENLLDYISAELNKSGISKNFK